MQSYINIAYPPVVFTFGYGSYHDYDFLIAISEAGNGVYFAMYTEEQIAEKIGFAFGGILTTVASDLTVDLQPSSGCRINTVTHGADESSINTDGSWSLKYSDLYAEEERTLTVDMDIPPSDTDQLVITITLKYYEASKNGYHFHI